jgi:hypothetical protein
MERLVRFELFGQEFSFYTDASETEVDQVINLVRGELAADAQGGRAALPSSKILVLGCLKIAARYVQLTREYEDYRTRQDRSIDKLIHKVSAGMEDVSERK